MNLKLYTFMLQVPGQAAPIVVQFLVVPTLEEVAEAVYRTLAGGGPIDLGTIRTVLEAAGISDEFLARSFHNLECSELPWPSIARSMEDGSTLSLQLLKIGLGEDYVGETPTAVVAPGQHVARVRALADGRNRPWLVVYTRNGRGEEIEVARIVSAFLPLRGLDASPQVSAFLGVIEGILYTFHEKHRHASPHE